MPTLDEDRFETYLRQFQPVVPDRLPVKERREGRWRYWVQISLAGATAIVILGSVTFRILMHRVAQKHENPISVEMIELTQPLRIADANTLLATAPSYRSAMRELAFSPAVSTFPKNKHSAFAVLAKEKTKL